MKQQDNEGPVTLGDLAREGRQRLWIYCTECGHNKHVAPLSIGLPLEQPVPTAGQRLVCSTCGGKRIHTKPEVYPEGSPTGRY